MTLLHRLKTGVVLTKDAILVLRHHPKLFVFPIISAVTGLAFLALFLGVTFGLMAIDPEGAVLVGLALAYFALTFVSSFFTAALVHQSRAAIAGERPSVRAGIEAAWGVKGKIAIWALVSATVGVIINAIENSNSSAARIFGTVFGVAWTLLTFFIIPTIVFEKPSTTGMFKSSASRFKETWGETPVSLVAVQIVSFVALVPFLLMAYLALSIDPILAIGFVLAGVLVGFLLTQTLQGVIKTALYIYATEGVRPPEFDDIDFDDLAREDERTSRPPSEPPTTGGFH